MTHRVQNSRFSFSSSTAPERQQLVMRMTDMRIKDVLSLVCEDEYSEKSAEPAIMAHMKLEKMSPNGRSSSDPARSRALFSAALQKKMNRYIALSKKHDATPSAKMRLSPRMVMNPLLMSDRELCFED